MKTVGELLSQARESQKITLEELSQRTKIDPRYIEALEANDYRHLPPNTFIKGFIRNIGLVLGKNPNELIAVFRRDYQTGKVTNTTQKHHSFKLNRSLLAHSQLPLVIIGIILFLSYLVFQYRTVIIPPKLIVVQPKANQVTTSPLIIEGTTTVDSIITINDQKDTNTDNSGHFSFQLALPIGVSQVKITATNRFGRTSTQTIPITII